MDYLQYCVIIGDKNANRKSFKPYYKWITFNTEELKDVVKEEKVRFKPYYKWITFNTV